MHLVRVVITRRREMRFVGDGDMPAEGLGGISDVALKPLHRLFELTLIGLVMREEAIEEGVT